MSIETRISSTTTIRGRVSGSADLMLDGRIEGDVSLEGNLTIDSLARVDGNIEAQHVEINGSVKGNILASQSLSIAKTAKIQGDLTAPTVLIADGALIRGGINIGDTTKMGRTASPTPGGSKKKASAARQEVEPDLPEGTVARKVKVKS